MSAEATSTLRSTFIAPARSLSTAWDLMVAVTARDLKVKYQGTLFSYLWWIARPLALGIVLYFALGRVLRLDGEGPRQIENYGVFLLAGLFPWFWFSGSLQQAVGIFVGNGGLLKKVRFPRLVLPFSAVFFNTIQFLLTLPIIALFVLTAGIEPEVSWLVGIPLLLALQLLLLVGLSAFVASLNVFIRDLGPFLDVVLLLLFYTSPVIYPLERVPDQFEPVLRVNPIVPLLEAWHGLFLRGALPGAELWPALVGTAVALALGLGVFRTLEKHFADAL